MTPRGLHPYTPARSGATLLESMVALAVLSMAFTVGAQMLGWSSAQRRLAEEQQIAMQEAANCLEHVRQLKWSELTPEQLAQIELSPEAQRRLRSSELSIRATPTSGDLAGQRIEVQVVWLTRHAQTPLHVQLITWRFPTEATP